MTDKKNQSKDNSRASSPDKKRGASGNQTNNNRSSSRQEYFKAELKRLEEGLSTQASKIQKPERKKHTPYTFNNLGPYYNAKVVQQIVNKPERAPSTPQTRLTATGLMDPWEAHGMDQLPKYDKDDREATGSTSDQSSKKDSKKKKASSKKGKEGSTRLPKFPAVSVPAGDLANKSLTYSDVPMLRKELREKYGNKAQEKIEKEYKRTKDDFYRMDLDLMDEYHPINRDHMRAAYFAYLQNNPGSKKAIKECVQEVTESLGEAKSPRSRPTSAVSQRSRPTSSHSRLSVKA